MGRRSRNLSRGDNDMDMKDSHIIATCQPMIHCADHAAHLWPNYLPGDGDIDSPTHGYKAHAHRLPIHEQLQFPLKEKLRLHAKTPRFLDDKKLDLSFLMIGIRVQRGEYRRWSTMEKERLKFNPHA